jgi:acid-sensing ion channel, other
MDLVLETSMHSSQNTPTEMIDAFENALKCNCLQGCTSISYETSVFQTKIDWKKFFENIDKTITMILDMDADRCNDFQFRIKSLYNFILSYDYSKVSIYLNKPQFIMSKRSELYGITDFLANCGGLIGVCLGFSILSLVEIIYFFIIR